MPGHFHRAGVVSGEYKAGSLPQREELLFVKLKFFVNDVNFKSLKSLYFLITLE